MKRYIHQIAAKTGNLFMTDKHVPPHTVGIFDRLDCNDVV